jgi:hypothetical protein
MHAKNPPDGPAGWFSLAGQDAQDKIVRRAARSLASQANTTRSTSAERRVFFQSANRVSSQDGPVTIGEAAIALMISSRPAAGNSYCIDALHSRSRAYFGDRLRWVTQAPNDRRDVLSPSLPMSGETAVWFKTNHPQLGFGRIMA